MQTAICERTRVIGKKEYGLAKLDWSQTGDAGRALALGLLELGCDEGTILRINRVATDPLSSIGHDGPEGLDCAVPVPLYQRCQAQRDGLMY